MKREDDRTSGTTVSFLDIIACAFGAIVLLVLILPVERLGALADSEPLNVDYGQLISERESLDNEINALTDEIERNRSLLQRLAITTDRKSARSDTYRHTIASTTEELASLKRKTVSTQAAQTQLRTSNRSMIRTTPSEYAGIPVDSEYIAFVIDTSSSMKSIWKQVVSEVEGVLSLYPEVKGFQILSDEGHYLYRSHRKSWMPDSPELRRRALDRLDNWRAHSNSSPANGIKTALRHLYDPNKKIALFVFGDDFSGLDDLDHYVKDIDRIVAEAKVTENSLRMHAFGFENNQTWSPLRYAVLMRTLTQRYGGAFLALPRWENTVSTNGT